MENHVPRSFPKMEISVPCLTNLLTLITFDYLFVFFKGEKLTDEEVDQIFAGLEDDNGNVQYDGEFRI